MKEKSYDYFQSQPCVFLKLAKDAADWVPKFYNESKLPAAMPSDLQDIVRNNVKNDKKFAVSFSFYLVKGYMGVYEKFQFVNDFFMNNIFFSTLKLSIILFLSNLSGSHVTENRILTRKT